MSRRWSELADFLVKYSTRIQPGEIALIHCIDGVDKEKEFVRELIEAVFKAGGEPLVWQDDQSLLRQMIMGASDRALRIMMERRLAEIKQVQAVFHLYSENNAREFCDIPPSRMDFYRKLVQPISDWRCNRTKRILTCLPNQAAAQLAGMSTAQFERFYFDACLGIDYEKMSQAMDLLVARMQATDQVRIVGPGTDLSFSILGIPAIKCAGRENLPDGEVFTAPVIDSVNGMIQFNTPTNYQGKVFEEIRLRFKNGMITHAKARDESLIDSCHDILNTDEGARFIGEFAFGLNPRITQPIGETLFDEKISGSIHLTPGSCYPEASNGNDESAIHWDLVLRQTPDCGGGEIYFDGKLIRRDGLFLGDLAALNSDNLEV